VVIVANKIIKKKITNSNEFLMRLSDVRKEEKAFKKSKCLFLFGIVGFIALEFLCFICVYLRVCLFGWLVFG